MEFIQSLLDSSHTPLITAFLLGILTAISPCPLATNVTAIGFISKDIGSKHQVFWRGILYTLGRILTYTLLGFLLIPILREGTSMFAIQKSIGKYGELLIAPALILIGLFMLFGGRLNLPKFGFSGNGGEKMREKGSWGSLLLGILFSLAFCPSSGVFYFGMLMPMAAAEAEGYLLPVIFAIATGLPVILVAWILAYSVAKLGTFYNRMQLFQKWMNKIVALLFIVIGGYYLLVAYI
ncbi:MAG: aromatic aminobenezylarsenical efflux permease ArsG family transporter [Phocaeicola sp.]